MLSVAKQLMQDGVVPSVSDVASAAEVSRATAYRYFPSQSALIEAVVDEALGPILDWRSSKTALRDRVDDLLSRSLPRIDAFEATFRAALRHAIGQGQPVEQPGIEESAPFKRGHRVELLRDAIGGAAENLASAQAERLAQGLSLLFGIEALVVLKDIWGLDRDRARDVILWAADALMTSALPGKGGMRA